jgi:hypothetical protein
VSVGGENAAGALYADELEDLLMDAMREDFNTECEDQSPREVRPFSFQHPGGIRTCVWRGAISTSLNRSRTIHSVGCSRQLRHGTSSTWTLRSTWWRIPHETV